MTEIYLLEQLDAFARFGTLSAAAEALHMSQPTLTRSMQKLESGFGVPLFEREGKRLRLNETGQLAADYAAKVLAMEAEMETRVRAHYRSMQTLHIGSAAPGPLMVLLPRLAAYAGGLTVSSTEDTEEALLKGLKNDEYTLIVLPRPVEDPEYASEGYITERLYLYSSIHHPAASMREVSFADMDGQSFLMYARVGFWEDIVREKMPNARFMKQDTHEALGALTAYSEFPSFTTNVTQRLSAWRETARVNIPFSDREASVRFWLVCRRRDYVRLKPLIEHLKEDNALYPVARET